MVFDYIIVGGGAAGCVLANRLSENPNIKVAVVESGPDKNARKTIVKMPLAMVTFMAPTLAFLGGPKFMSWFESEPEPGLQGRKLALPRGQGVGGCTNINGQIYIRGQREDYDHWRDLGCEGWSYDDLLPYFKKIERFEMLANPRSAKGFMLGAKPLAAQIDATYHGLDGPLNIAAARSNNRLNTAFFDAAQTAGFELNPDFNGAKQSGIGYYTFTQKNGERASAEAAYLNPIRNRPNLTILPNRQVTRIIMEGKKAVGVAWSMNSKAGETRGYEIILSAGTFASPQLLMLSGIGNRKELERHKINLVHHLPGVGENLQDHLDITLEFKAKDITPYGISWRALPRNMLHVLDWLFRRRGLFASTTAEAGGFVSTDPKTTRPDIQLFLCSAKGNTQSASGFAGHAFLLHVTELRPGFVGKLSLKSANPKEKPSIIFNIFRGPSNESALRKGIHICRKLVAQKAFAPFLESEASPGPEVQSEGAIDAFIRQTVGTLFHPVGTCTMGKGKMAVVDPATLRVHGLQGLRVVDASIMPSIVSANTLAATYCLAEKAAESILKN
jgi:choline dehydrogenase